MHQLPTLIAGMIGRIEKIFVQFHGHVRRRLGISALATARRDTPAEIENDMHVPLLPASILFPDETSNRQGFSCFFKLQREALYRNYSRGHCFHDEYSPSLLVAANAAPARKNLAGVNCAENRHSMAMPARPEFLLDRLGS